jgi:hypothetical protein
MSDEKSIPYMAFSNEELDAALPVNPGDQIVCNRCGETHTLEDADPPGMLMTVLCGSASYLAAVRGRLVINAPVIPRE